MHFESQKNDLRQLTVNLKMSKLGMSRKNCMDFIQPKVESTEQLYWNLMDREPIPFTKWMKDLIISIQIHQKRNKSYFIIHDEDMIFNPIKNIPKLFDVSLEVLNDSTLSRQKNTD